MTDKLCLDKQLGFSKFVENVLLTKLHQLQMAVVLSDVWQVRCYVADMADGKAM